MNLSAYDSYHALVGPAADRSAVNPWTHHRFQQQVTELVDTLTGPDLLMECRAASLLTDRQYADLDSIKVTWRRNEQLISILKKGKAESFATFLDIVKKVEPACNVKDILAALSELL